MSADETHECAILAEAIAKVCDEHPKIQVIHVEGKPALILVEEGGVPRDAWQRMQPPEDSPLHGCPVVYVRPGCGLEVINAKALGDLLWRLPEATWLAVLHRIGELRFIRTDG